MKNTYIWVLGSIAVLASKGFAQAPGAVIDKSIIDKVMQSVQPGAHCDPSSRGNCSDIDSKVENFCSYRDLQNKINADENLQKKAIAKKLPPQESDPAKLADVLASVNMNSARAKVLENSKQLERVELPPQGGHSSARTRMAHYLDLQSVIDYKWYNNDPRLLSVSSSGHKQGYLRPTDPFVQDLNYYLKSDGKKFRQMSDIWSHYTDDQTRAMISGGNFYFTQLNQQVNAQINGISPNTHFAYDHQFSEIAEAVRVVYGDLKPEEQKLVYARIFEQMNRKGAKVHGGSCITPQIYVNRFQQNFAYADQHGKVPVGRDYASRKSFYAEKRDSLFSGLNGNIKCDPVPSDYHQFQPLEFQVAREEMHEREIEEPHCDVSIETQFHNNSSGFDGEKFNMTKIREQMKATPGCEPFLNQVPSKVRIAAASNAYKNASPYCARDFEKLSRNRVASIRNMVKADSEWGSADIEPHWLGENGDGTSGSCPYDLKEVSGDKYAGQTFPYVTTINGQKGEVLRAENGKYYFETMKDLDSDSKSSISNAKYAKVTLIFGNKETRFAGQNAREKRITTGVDNETVKGDVFSCYQIVYGCLDGDIRPSVLGKYVENANKGVDI